jgi:hypothetical protein
MEVNKSKGMSQLLFGKIMKTSMSTTSRISNMINQTQKYDFSGIFNGQVIYLNLNRTDEFPKFVFNYLKFNEPGGLVHDA